MGWIDANRLYWGAFVIGLMLSAGATVFETAKGAKRPKFVMYMAFSLALAAGLCFCVALFPMIRWLTTRAASGGALLASIVTISTVWVGWQAIYMLIAMFRDIADKKAGSKDALKAARWVPTLLPIGAPAFISLITHPRTSGFGLGLSVATAAIVSLMSVIYTFMIFNATDAANTQSVFWKRFCLAVAILAGIIHIAAINYADTMLSGVVSSGTMAWLRAIAGLGGAVLILCGLRDWAVDNEPDKWSRRAGVYGIPLVTLFFSLGVSLFSTTSSSGLEQIGRWVA